MKSMNIKKIALIGAVGLMLTLGTSTYSNAVYAKIVNYNSEILKVGTRGDLVRQLQDELRKLGYFRVASTGYYGNVTKNAVTQFQKDHGLMVDGIAGSQTVAAINNKSTDNPTILKIGSRGETVKNLQTKLKDLGYFHVNPTGYYGDITKNAVIQFQQDNGIIVDGIAGNQTLTALYQASPAKSSRSRTNSQNLLVPWFNQAEHILAKGTVATVTDVDTGKQFKIKRITGYNHADVETLTAEDTSILKNIYGGQWSWERRAVIVNVNGREMAASLAAMPHAGREDQPYGAVVNNRSGGYGRGANLDGVKGNNMSGVIDLHFYKSKTHGSNRVDPAHQNMVRKAANSR